MDCVKADRGVWLVKVPKYVSERWRKSTRPEVGKLAFRKVDLPSSSGSTVDVKFVLHEDKADDNPIPKEHKFEIGKNDSHTLVVYSQNQDRLCVEGKVVERADCRPCNNDDSGYMKLKKQSFTAASLPKRAVKQLDRVVNTYKPVANHKSNIEYDLKKKSEGKRIRLDKNEVAELLFAAFEKHQYYNIKDLAGITRQPFTYLKEILNEFCKYNMKNPHRNMWELKPEYRHYK